MARVYVSRKACKKLDELKKIFGIKDTSKLIIEMREYFNRESKRTRKRLNRSKEKGIRTEIRKIYKGRDYE